MTKFIFRSLREEDPRVAVTNTNTKVIQHFTEFDQKTVSQTKKPVEEVGLPAGKVQLPGYGPQSENKGAGQDRDSSSL